MAGAWVGTCVSLARRGAKVVAWQGPRYDMVRRMSHHATSATGQFRAPLPRLPGWGFGDLSAHCVSLDVGLVQTLTRDKTNVNLTL